MTADRLEEPTASEAAWYRVVDLTCEMDEATNEWPPPVDEGAARLDKIDRLAGELLDATARVRGLVRAER